MLYIYISHIVITMSRHKSNPDGESIMDHIAIVMDQLLFVGSCSWLNSNSKSILVCEIHHKSQQKIATQHVARNRTSAGQHVSTELKVIQILKSGKSVISSPIYETPPLDALLWCHPVSSLSKNIKNMTEAMVSWGFFLGDYWDIIPAWSPRIQAQID